MELDVENPPQSNVVEVTIPYATTGVHYGRFVRMEEMPEGGSYDLIFDENLWHCVRITTPVQRHIRVSFVYVISGSSVVFRNYVSLDFLYISIRSNLRNLNKTIIVQMVLPPNAVVIPPYPQKDPPDLVSYWNGSTWEVRGDCHGVYIG